MSASGMRGALLPSAVALVALALFVPCQGAYATATGVATEGHDRARVVLPVAAPIESYSNFGYALRVSGGVAEVEVDLAPLESQEPFVTPAGLDYDDPIARLASSVTAGASTRYLAASRLFDWMARNIRYELDRSKAQGALEVLERRSGYCTGVARLTVALLQAVGIPAREVPGYVVTTEPGGPAGYHRWVELYYGDRGWVFTDPLLTHHYVPASYLRLAGEGLLSEPENDSGRLLTRDDGRRAVDLFLQAPAGVSVRRNSAAQLAGTLEVELGEAVDGHAVLVGAGRRRVGAVLAGRSTFVGLEPGDYVLTVWVEGHPPRAKRVVFRGRVQGAVHFPMPVATGGLPAAKGVRG